MKLVWLDTIWVQRDECHAHWYVEIGVFPYTLSQTGFYQIEYIASAKYVNLRVSIGGLRIWWQEMGYLDKQCYGLKMRAVLPALSFFYQSDNITQSSQCRQTMSGNPKMWMEKIEALDAF